MVKMMTSGVCTLRSAMYDCIFVLDSKNRMTDELEIMVETKAHAHAHVHIASVMWCIDVWVQSTMESQASTTA